MGSTRLFSDNIQYILSSPHCMLHLPKQEMHNVENYSDQYEEAQGWNVSLLHCWILQKKKKEKGDAKNFFFLKDLKWTLACGLSSSTAQSFRLTSSDTLEVLFNIPANTFNDSFELPDSCALLQRFYFSLQLSSHNETYSWKQVGSSCAGNLRIKRSPWSTNSHGRPWSVLFMFHSACTSLCIKMEGGTTGSSRTEIPASENLLCFNPF